MQRQRVRPLRWIAAGFIVALAFPLPGQADDEKPSGTIEIQ